MGAMTSTLDNLLRGMSGMGDPRNVDLTATDDPDSGGNNPMDLIYVVPTGVANCGSADATVVAFTAAVNGAIATDVAEGFTEVKDAYDLLVTQEGVVESAQTALNTARMNATATNPNTTAINSAQAILDAATTELAKRQTALDAIAAGPIYQAGIAEWRASGCGGSTTVAAWNMAVDGVTNTAMTGALDVLDAASYGGPRHQNADGDVLTGYVALLDSRTGGQGADPSGSDAGSVGNVLNADGTVNIANMRTYADVAGDGTRTTDNFNDDGSLRVPMRATLDPDDGNAMEVLPTTATIADIRADREAANNAVAALEEAQAKNTNRNLDIAYEEAVRRARLEAAHLNAQWNAAITDAIDLRADNQKLSFLDDGTGEGIAGNGIRDGGEADNPNYVDAFSLLSLNTEYQGALAKRDTAESALRMAVADREAKTRATINSFTSPGSFYQQLVDRRQALLDDKQNTVNRIVNAGGTPTTAQNTAVDDAQEALDDANKVKGNYDALVSDDNNPAVGLVDELAKTGGDDGQALVSAITGNYDATQANEDRLDALLTTGDDGTESGRVKALEDKVTMLEGGNTGGGLEELRTDLDALTAMDDPETMENENGAVTQNAADISMLDSDLTKLEGTVDDNSADLDTVWDDLFGGQRGVEAQHGDPANCDSTSTRTGDRLNCVEALSQHNEDDIEDVNDKLMDKKEYIDNLGAAIGVDPVTGEGTEDGKSRIDMNAEANMKLGERIDGLTAGADTEDTSDDGPITANAMGVAANKQAIMNEAEARGKADMALGGRIDTESSERKAADTALGGRIDTESSERKAADTALGGRIDAEETARMKGDADEMEARMAADEAEMNARMAADKAEMDARMMADDALGSRIDAEAMARSDADMALGMRIDGEEMARADADVMLGDMIMAEGMARMSADTALSGRIDDEAMARMSADAALGGRIDNNRAMIGALDTRLTGELETVRAGVAASMALAGMPAINGRGIAIGVGSYDGESAFAVGFQIQGEQASFKVGVTSSGGETGASAGVGFNF